MGSSIKRDFSSIGKVSQRCDVPRRIRFQVLLKRIGLSQNQLADQVGIGKGTMSKIANGLWFPTSDVIVRICKILEIESVYLFGDSTSWNKWQEKINYQGEGK